MASLNLAGKTSGYVKVTAPDDSSTNPTVVLPKESGELALKSDITGGGGGGGGGEVQPPVAFQAGISSSAYTVSSNLYEKIAFNAVEHDTNNFYDETNKEFTPNIEGYYLVTLNTRTEANNLTRGLAVIFKNDGQAYGGNEIFDDAPVKNAITSVATGLVYCNGVDDSISGKVLAKTTDGTSITLKKNASTNLSIHLVTGQSTGGGGDSIWTDVDGNAVYEEGNVGIGTDKPVSQLDVKGKLGDASNNFNSTADNASLALSSLDTNTSLFLGVKDGDNTWVQPQNKDNSPKNLDINPLGGTVTVNGIPVGKGKGDSILNTVMGFTSFDNNTTGVNNSVYGAYSLQNNETGVRNSGFGMSSLQNSTGDRNTGLGYEAGSSLTTGTNNTMVGYGSQPSAPDVSNEVTIGNDGITKTRLQGTVTTKGGLGVGNRVPEDYSLYNSVFAVGNGQGVGIVKENLSDNAYLYFGSGTSELDQQTASISSKGSNLVLQVGAQEALSIDGVGKVTIPIMEDNASGTPVVVNSLGTLMKGTSTYSAEEVDKKLAIKDKLIEKLSERLDKLEKKLKKAK